MRNLLRWLLIFSALGIPTANAAEWSAPTDLELKRLPAYCTVSAQRLRGDKAAAESGFAQLGEQFKNVQHYCWGLNFLNRYYGSTSSEIARSNIKFAFDEFTYMADHMVQDSSLAADIFLQRGIVQSLMKRNTEAITDLNKALSYNPRSAKAYLTMANLLENMKQQGKALEMVTEGLRHVPESKVLKRRYEELGGKLPYPEPVVAQTKPEVRTDNPKPKEADSETTGANPQAQTSNNSAEEPAADKGAEKETSTEDASTKRWCRFCVD